jgi:hypothetical protein
MFNNQFSLLDDTVIKQKQQELQRWVEYNRLVKEALKSRPARTPVTQILRLWLGRKMIDLGKGLVESLERPEPRRIEFT